MIFFERFGQLGNQIFQVAYALSIRSPNETVYITDINEFVDCCELPPAVINVTDSATPWLRFLFKSRLLRVASMLRITGGIREIHAPDGSVEVRHWRGLLPVRYVWKGWFQDHRVARQTGDATFVVRARVLEAAAEWLEHRCGQANPRIFCHLRRSDYLNWYQRGINVALPLDYYRRGLALLRRDYPDAKILLASDDVEFLELAFPNEADRIIVEEEPTLTLAILSLCDHAIISNSSFAWWAGFSIARRGGRVLAPTHWLGWKDRRWTPPAIAEPTFEWIRV